MAAQRVKSYNSSQHLYQASSSDEVYPSHLKSNVPDEAKQNDSCFSNILSKILMFGNHLIKIRLEMIAFLYTFSYVLTGITSTAMIMDKICLVHFGYSHSICDNLENFTTIKTSVEKLATNYQLGRSLVQVAPATVLACFIGPWSDQYGRKLPVIMALSGMILDAVGSTFCAYFLESRVEYYFIPAIFTGIFGGPVSILAVLYCYASDSTQLLERTMKYAFIEMASGFAAPFGAAAGGWIYDYLGYTAVFLFASSGLVLSLILTVFLLKETRGLDNYDPWSIKLKKLFSCHSFIESFVATVKERPNKGKIQVILLISSMCFLMITQYSTSTINFIYAHHQFGWSNKIYSTFTSIYSIFAIAMLMIIIPVAKRFKIDDPYLGLLGTISGMVKNFGVGIAGKSTGVYHVANFSGFLSGCANFAGRSRISKIVSNEDLGKVFSFVAAAEAILPIITTILMSQLFRAFIETFPGLPYVVLAISLAFPLGVFCWMTCLRKINYADISHTTQSSKDGYYSLDA